MKKILSMLLVLCMLASSCLFFVSCSGGLDAKKAGKDPLGTIVTAFDNSLSAFFTDDAGASKVLEKAAKKGSYDITLSSDKWMGEDLTKIREVVYVDAKNNALVSDTYVTYDGIKYNATVWADKTGIALKSESLFGNDDTLRLVFETFIKEFENSDLFDIIQTESEMEGEDAEKPADELADELINVITGVRGIFDEKNAIMSEKEMKALTLDICRILDQSITTTEKADMNSEMKTHIAIEYTLNNDNLAELCKLLLDTAEEKKLMADQTEFEEMKRAVNSALDMIDKNLELDAEVTFYINADAFTMTSADVDVQMTFLDGAEVNGEMDLKMELLFSKNQILVSGEVGYDKMDYGIELIIAKEKAGDTTTYDMDATLTSGNIKMNLLDAQYTYNKKTFEMECKGKVSLGALESTDFSMTAEYKASKTEVSFELKSFEISNKREELFKLGRGDELSIVIQPLNEIPAVDDRAEDIMDMSARDWNKLVEGIQNSQLGKLLFTSRGESDAASPMPDVNP